MTHEHNSNIDFNNSSNDMSIALSDNSPLNYVSQRPHRQEDKIELTSQFNDFKEEMRKLITFYSTRHTEELSEIRTNLRELRETNLNIENAVRVLSAQNEDLQKKMISLENQVREERQYILYLEAKLEDAQCDTRKTNFQIKNVPKKVDETKQDLIDMALCLSKTVECRMEPGNIKDIYRVKGKNQKQNAPIIVETTSALLKADMLKKVKTFNTVTKQTLSAKHLGFKTSEDTPVFLSEHLTAKGSRLHFLARDLKKSRGYKFCWTSYGRVYVRKDENSPTILINSEDQVQQLLSKD
ncbi:hypothetical protein NE865_09323 [Phthorimaea operculella]|nr:hypothetical protein NE865_09323 [Phthorimaea operculella]